MAHTSAAHVPNIALFPSFAKKRGGRRIETNGVNENGRYKVTKVFIIVRLLRPLKTVQTEEGDTIACDCVNCFLKKKNLTEQVWNGVIKPVTVT